MTEDAGRFAALRRPDVALAVFRCGVAAAILAIGLAGDADSAVYWVAAGLAAAAAVAALGVALRSGGRSTAALQLRVSVGMAVLVLACLATSGDEASPLRWVLILVAPTFSAFYPPRQVVTLAGATLAGYLAMSLDEIAAPQGHEVRDIVVTTVVLLLATLSAVTAALLRLEAAARIARLDDARRDLLRRALSAEYETRRSLSADLHDETLQLLLTTRQDLEEGSHGDADALTFARESLDLAIARIRSNVRDLHPVALEHGGLGAAVIALSSPLHGAGIAVDLHVDREAHGMADDAIVPIVRELVENVVEQGSASSVALWVVATTDHLEIVLSDDGVGFRFEPDREQPRGRGPGLAFAAERAAAAGGSMSISTHGGGTTVRVQLPYPAASGAARTGRSSRTGRTASA